VAIGKDRMVGRQLRTLIQLGAIGDLSDGQLLERFATSQGEAAELAFSALVERHGSMVLRVCRSVLDDPHASEDAFQATFLVLVAKGRTLWVRDSLGPWLHQVAHRTARCARSNAARRKRLERAASLVRSESESQIQPEPTDEIERVLLEEIDRLPERYKAPVVLCDLEGRTHEAAARALGWPIGTVKSRQSRARERLRDQLTRRGFAPSSSLAILALPRLGPSISVLLMNSTTTLAIRYVATRAIARGSATWLAQEVLRSMTILRSAKIASILIALGAAGSGAGLIAQGPGEASKKPEQKADPKPQAKAKEKPQAPEPPDDESIFTVKPGKLELTETAAGILESLKSQELVSEVEEITTILTIKPEWTTVSKGEIVCELDSISFRKRLVDQKIVTQQAETAYKQAKLVQEVAEFAVKEYREGILPADRARLKGKIADAERALKDGEARLERTKVARKKLDAMFDATKGPATPTDIVADLNVNDLLDAAGRNISDQRLALELARSELDVLERFASEMRTRKIEVDLEKAKGDEFTRKTQWDLAKEKQDMLGRMIEHCRLVAPSDGLLFYADTPADRMRNMVDIREGSAVQKGSIICRVIDLKDPMQVNAKVSEALVDQVKIGSKATIKVDARPNETVTGTVVSVAPMADTDQLRTNKRKVYTTLILLDPLDQAQLKLRPGMSARATIMIKEIDNVLTIPTGLVHTIKDGNGEKHQVDVKLPGGTIERRDVVLGMAGGRMYLGKWQRPDQIEIKEGLKAGDRVVRMPGGGLQ
jgi:HlyD family secretion protein